VCVCELTGGLGAAEDESRDVDESTSRRAVAGR